jgi:hypothetical protein
MTECCPTEVAPKLGDWAREATQALAQLDADRLEDLASSCQLLYRRMEQGDCALPWSEAARAKREMAVLDRLLAITRENLRVARRRFCHSSESSDYRGSMDPSWSRMEGFHGND